MESVSTLAWNTHVGLRQVELENPGAIALALDWHAQGMDFADALHLASSSKATHFATFDRKLAKQAEACQTMEIIRV